MRVLQINSVCGIGSTGRIATDIHNILIDQGHESYIAYGRGEAKNCDNAIRIGTKLDNYFHVTKTRIFDQHGFGSKKSTIDFIKRVKELNPDIIHLHNIHGYYINIEILFNYLKKANKPVVWTLHDCWSFTGHCAYFDYVGCDKWKKTCNDCPQKKAYPSSLVLDNSKNNFIRKKSIFTGIKNLTIVTPSEWLGGLVNQSYLRRYPVKIINNGIDLETFKPSKNNFKEKHQIQSKFIMLGVASVWEKRKGLKYFIELSQRMDKNDIIVLVGLTEDQKNKLPNNVIGITRTNNVKELAEIYTAADVFINPTLEDNFPTTNLEALACGTPVVTFDTGGSGESIDLDCGFVVKKGDFKTLLEKLKEIKEYGADTYKNNCLEKAKLYYNKRETFEKYINLYKQI